MRFNGFYLLILVLAGALFFLTQKLYHSNGKAWVGVAEAKDYTISSEKQATVQSIPVVQGQSIKSGDTLIKLSSLQLVQDINKMENRIATLQSERNEKKNLAVSEGELLKSTLAIEINQLEKEITVAEKELKLNKNITGNLKLAPGEPQSSPLEEKIKALKEEINLRNRDGEIKIRDLNLKFNTDQNLLQNQIQLLQNELTLLRKEKANLIKVSLADGVVESIPVKIGDEVDAYTRLLSISPTHPTSVIAYMQSEKTTPSIGTQVKIQSYHSRWKESKGKVIGFGAVTVLPDILQKATAVKAFGKEVFIEIPPQNEFSTGEKLLIRLWED